MQAWDIVLINRARPSDFLSDSRLRVSLPSGNIRARLIQTGGEFDVYFVDTVFFDNDCDQQYVKQSLIDHDGFPSNIRVKRVR